MKTTVAVFITLIVFFCSTSFAAIMWAGTPLVDLNGSAIVEATGETVTTWTNSVTSAIGDFVADATPPVVEEYVSPLNAVVTKVLNFDGANTLKGGNSYYGIHGGNDWSVEAWVLNPELVGAKTIVAWGRQGGAGLLAAFMYSTFLVNSAADHGNWDTSIGYYGGYPSAGKWHHIAWTFTGGTLGTESVYVDGILNATNAKTLTINASRPVRVGGQTTATLTLDPAQHFSGKIAAIRIHDGVLDPNQIQVNFEEEMANFGLAPVGKIVAGRSIDFGMRAGGTGPGNEVIVTIQNSPLAFGDLEFTEDLIIMGPFVLVPPDPVYDTLIPGATMEFGVAFDPLDDDPACGLITIRSNDADGDFLIQLRGNQISYEDDFSVAHNYATEGVTGTIWDGTIKNTLAALNMFDASTTKPGYLTIGGGTGTDSWDGASQGVLLYKNVTGDFIADMEIGDASGPGYAADHCPFTSVGLMVRVGDLAAAGPGEDRFFVDWFPAWGNSNFIRTTDNNVNADLNEGGGEENAGKFIQVERVGNTFHCRRKQSAGAVWVDLAASPYTRNDMNGLPVQVGVCYSTYNTQDDGHTELNYFKISIPSECNLGPTPTPMPTRTPTPLPPPNSGIEGWSVFK